MSHVRCVLAMDPRAPARSGSLARVVGVFADRGVSLDEVHAGTPGGGPRIELAFSADPAATDAILRRLRRLPDVRSVIVG